MKFPFEPAGLIFDLDGTLLDTEPLYTEATQKVLDPFGHTYTMELKRKVMGGDSTRSARLTIEEFGLSMTPEAFLAERETHLTQMFPDVPEIANAGAYLHHSSNGGANLGLATSSHSHLKELKLNKRSWRDVFNAEVCGNDNELKRGKPAPDIFLLCASRLGVQPELCVAFEDSENGILSAKSAGMFVVAIESPYTTKDQLAAADLIISDYLELID